MQNLRGKEWQKSIPRLQHDFFYDFSDTKMSNLKKFVKKYIKCKKLGGSNVENVVRKSRGIFIGKDIIEANSFTLDNFDE